MLVIPGDVSTQEAGDDTITGSTISAGPPGTPGEYEWWGRTLFEATA